MSTRSIIARELPDGKVESIYCHWDGYPAHNGLILLNHYTNPAKIDELFKLGNLSSLREEIGDPSKEHHTFARPRDGWVIAYGRDREEEGQESTIYGSIMGLHPKNHWAEWIYLWNGTHWEFCDIDEFPVFKQLTQFDCKKEY